MRAVLVLVLVLVLGALGACATPPPPMAFPAKLLRGHEGALVAGDISADGKWAASVDVTGEVRYWEIDRPDRPLVMEKQGDVRSLALTRSGERIYAGCDDGSIKVLADFSADVRHTGFSTVVLQGSKGATANLRLAPDEKTLLSWERDAIVWDLARNEPRTRIQGPVLAVTRDARFVAVRRTGLALVDVGSGFARWISAEPVSAVAFSEDGRRVAIGTESGTLELRDAESGAVIARADGFAGGVRSAVFSPDGKLLVAGAKRGDSDRLLAVPALAEVRVLPWQNAAHAFSRDSSRLVSIIGQQWAVVFDVKTGKELAEFWAGPRKRSWRLDFSPDGRFLIAQTDLGEWRVQTEITEARIFDASALKRLAVVEGAGFVFTPDSKHALWLRVLDGIVCVADSP